MAWGRGWNLLVPHVSKEKKRHADIPGLQGQRQEAPLVPTQDNAQTEEAMKRSPKLKRSTSGCGVCRIRHVRCDETRPSCHRCTRTSRACDGYQPGATRLPSARMRALAPMRLTSQGPLSSSQSHLGAAAQRALQYYRINTAKHLSGYFHDELWTTLVLQVGNRDQCVSYALVALASLHEHFDTEAARRLPLTPGRSVTASHHGGPTSWSPPMQHAVSYYAKAVRQLHAQISAQNAHDIETSLLGCLLLSGFELLRGYNDAAQVHLHGSASLLKAWKDQQTRNRGGSQWSPQGYFIRERLGPLFHRMALQAVLFGHPGPTPPSLSYPDDAGAKDNSKWMRAAESEIRVASPTEARDTLYRLIWQRYLLPEGQRHRPGASQTKRARVKGRDHFIGSLHQWYKALSEYLEMHPLDGASATMLKLFHVAARIIIPTCMSEDQMAFDRFDAQFHEMTDLAETLLFMPSPSPSPLPRPPSDAGSGSNTAGRTILPAPGGPAPPRSQGASSFFSLDMGVLHLLYHVAIRCRVARTRGRALALLQRAQARREGVWDGAATALVAGRVIALEEQARRPVGGMAEPGPGGGCIPAEARVTAIWTETDLELRRVVLRYERQRGTACSEEVLTW